MKIDLKDPRIKALVVSIKEKCKTHNISFILEPKKKILLGTARISGYFDNISRELCVAANSPLALEVLIHESCHLDQWASSCQEWIDLDFEWRTTVIESHYLFDLWLSGAVDIKQDILDKLVKRIMDNERDCERRSVAKIQKWKLLDLIDLDQYCRRANSYILGYQLVQKNRKWFQKSPYLVDSVWQICARRIVSGYKMSTIVEKRMQKECF